MSLLFPRIPSPLTAFCCALLCSITLMASTAHAAPANAVPPPASLQVRGTLPAPRPGVTDLKFGELFQMPVGPKGLEASDKLKSLVGQRVRMVGYAANAEAPTPGMFILSPLPVALGDEDEKLVDDLPPTAVFVRLSAKYASKAVPNLAGLVVLEGRLELGAQEEADGHVSTTRLVLDDKTSRLLTSLPHARAAQQPTQGQRVASHSH
jgi:hypothetical protein